MTFALLVAAFSLSSHARSNEINDLVPCFQELVKAGDPSGVASFKNFVVIPDATDKGLYLYSVNSPGVWFVPFPASHEGPLVFMTPEDIDKKKNRIALALKHDDQIHPVLEWLEVDLRKFSALGQRETYGNRDHRRSELVKTPPENELTLDPANLSDRLTEKSKSIFFENLKQQAQATADAFSARVSRLKSVTGPNYEREALLGSVKSGAESLNSTLEKCAQASGQVPSLKELFAGLRTGVLKTAKDAGLSIPTTNSEASAGGPTHAQGAK